MEISHRRLNRVDVLSLSGRLDAASSPSLRQQIDSLFAENRYRIVLDLAGLEMLSSAGLRIHRSTASPGCWRPGMAARL